MQGRECWQVKQTRVSHGGSLAGHGQKFSGHLREEAGPQQPAWAVGTGEELGMERNCSFGSEGYLIPVSRQLLKHR